MQKSKIYKEVENKDEKTEKRYFYTKKNSTDPGMF